MNPADNSSITTPGDPIGRSTVDLGQRSPSPVGVLAYYNVNEGNSGGLRRVHELLHAIGPERAWLIQPRPAHPVFQTDCFSRDFGVRRVGINWGIFNYYWPPTSRRVRRWVMERQPACLVLTSIWAWAPFARAGAPCPVILDAQNVDAIAIGERFGFSHPFTRRVTQAEQKVLRVVDRIFCCSDVDRDHVAERYGVEPERVRVIPNGADVPSDSEILPGRLDADLESWLGDATALLFVGGKLDYPPNAEGLSFICDQLVPELERRKAGAYRVLVMGAPVPSIRLPESVRCLGRVPSLAPYLRRADIGLAPIFSGSGTRLKVLDYLAWGKPVVSTPKGAEGIDSRDGEHLILAPKEKFADAVHRLAQDPATAARLGQNGRRLIQARYSWTAIRDLWRAGVALD